MKSQWNRLRMSLSMARQAFRTGMRLADGFRPGDKLDLTFYIDRPGTPRRNALDNPSMQPGGVGGQGIASVGGHGTSVTGRGGEGGGNGGTRFQSATWTSGGTNG